MFNFRKISIYILATILSVSFCTLIFVLYVLNDIPTNKLSAVESSAVKNVIEFEAGTYVSKKELRTFHLMGKETRPYSLWLNDKISSNAIGQEGEGLTIFKQFSVSDLFNNDCSYIYCFQKRVSFSSIPSVFWKALIGIEDNRFLDHSGIDFRSIFRAIIMDIKEMKLVQGGSTLTQQLVKNLFFTNKKSFIRKIKEVIVSIYIESNYTKENILEAYFNELEWGSLQGMRIKGIYMASIFYFNKRPSEVSSYEAAILIGLLKGPYYYRPLKHLERLKVRTNIVFNKLISLNLYGNIGEKTWNDDKWDLWVKELKTRNEERNLYNLWLSTKNDSDILDNYEKFVFVSSANKILNEIKEKAKGQDIAIKAIIGSPVENKKPFIFYSKYERDLSVAIRDEKHQVGSTLKPLIYSSFFKHGKKPSDLVKTTKIDLDLISGRWSPSEDHKIDSEEVTITEALQNSYNRPVIHLANEIGFGVIEKDLLGHIKNLKVPLKEYPAQLLGAVEMSLLDLYKTYRDLMAHECQKRLLNQDNVIDILSDPRLTTIKRLVNRGMKNLEFFGKTGTSNQGHDNWFVMFDGNLLSIVWVGLEGKRDTSLKLYGGTTAFKLLQYFNSTKGKRFNDMRCEIFPKFEVEL